MTQPFATDRRVYWTLAALILLLATFMRLQVVNGTLIDVPYRADSAQYFDYAYNLRHHGVYSYQHAAVVDDHVQPTADAMRPPGYSLFLVPFAVAPPTRAIFHTISLWQAGLGVLTVWLVLLFGRRVLVPGWVLLAAGLVAISPQQVVIATFNLSENLFTPLLVLILLALAWATRSPRAFGWAMLVTGLVIGLAALTRPVLEYFLPFLALLAWTRWPAKQALKGSVLLAIGFVLMWGPWVARNYATLGKAGDNHLLIATLHQGVYPDLMYKDMPQSLGVPYRFDPDYKRTDATLDSALAEVLRFWREDPARELAWYLVGKPIQLWSWDMVASGPHADVFIYKTRISPYHSNPFFLATHALMRGLHWPLVVLAFALSLFVLLPKAARCWPSSTLFLLRAMSVLLLYNTAVLMLGAPFPRYSTPFLPIVFCMALAVLEAVVRACRQHRSGGDSQGGLRSATHGSDDNKLNRDSA